MHAALSSEVHEELERILVSKAFSKADQLRELISYLVKKRLEDPKSALKETVLGVDVFRRGPDFDPKADPIVRVEMRRLRARLAGYYSAEGASDPLRIVLQPGSYVPSFEVGLPGAGFQMRCVAVLPFLNLSPHQEDAYFLEGLVEEILNAATRTGQLRVIGRSPLSNGGDTHIKKRPQVDHIVEGSLRREDALRRTTVRLMSLEDSSVVWSHQFDYDSRHAFAAQEAISQRVTSAMVNLHSASCSAFQTGIS